MRRNLIVFLILGLAIGGAYLLRHRLPDPIATPLGLRPPVSEVRAAQTPVLTTALGEQGLTFGAPVYLRVFKEEAELELWVQTGDRFRLFKTYPICNYSGHLGPKLKEGDRQSPEGFYRVYKSSLNPDSRFHLSFNLGFPNRFDRAQGRTGSYLMIHGDCVSVGCYAMTDAGIEEIFVLVEAALRSGQSFVPVHAFPFRMTNQRMTQAKDNTWLPFWQDLMPAYVEFEESQVPPQISVKNGRYDVSLR
ncbi:murein L,D-transpeptidase family protein [Shimia sp.]|uniref:murein L,D-transpeptidase family protein n=1 Tax=Shimia sp. TaxID=1954381 RepID=UPI0032985788